MPELPEVETIRRDLEKKLVGLRLLKIDVRLPKIFQGNLKDVIGAKVTKIWRRAKILGIDFDNGRSLIFHLKLTGQLVFASDTGGKTTFGHPIPFAGEELPAKTTHVIFSFSSKPADSSTPQGKPFGFGDSQPEGLGSARKLFFNDLRQFGWVKVINGDQKAEISEKMGIEPLTEEFTAEALGKIVSKTRKPTKPVLMDQEKIAGIGNIYANEALFEAGIHPQRPAKELSGEEVGRLRDAIVKVLNEGIECGGSSAADEAYIKPSGEPGGYQKHFRVYQRAGEPCPRCGMKIQRVNLGGRGTFFCSKCQK